MLFINISCYSQERNNYKKLTVTGTVYDIESLDSLPFSKIIVNKNQSFVTDSKGYFYSKLSVKDTLTISHLGYTSSEIIIAALITNYDSLNVNVLLKEQIYNIPAVSVFPYKSYNDFLRAIMKDEANSQVLNNASENIKMMKTQIRMGYFPANDALANYNYIMNYKPLSANSIVLFSSHQDKGIIPALKKIIKK